MQFKFLPTSCLVVAFSLAVFWAQAQAFTIASIGDSYASGEGNPDKPQTFKLFGFGGVEKGPVWEEGQQCHRSRYAGPYLAAHEIARIVNQPLTFIGLACTGAQIPVGLLGPFNPKTDDRVGPVPPQIEQLKAKVGSGRIDLLLISIGGNDMGFANLIKNCAILDSAQFIGFPGALCRQSQAVVKTLRENQEALPGKYKRLAQELRTMDIGAVLISEYPDPTKGADGKYCGSSGNHRMLLMHPETVRWAYYNVVKPLNAAIHAAATEYGWAVVPMMDVSAKHGYCAGKERWFLTEEEARFIQGPYEGGFSERDHLPAGSVSDGSLHPNLAGHLVYARQIANTFWEAGRMFDRTFYLASNADVQQAVGTNYDAVLEHWKNQGLSEGRRGSREFDVKFYLANYPDLQSSLGTNYRAAVGHWVSQGLPVEGRRGSREFDVQFYLAAHPELQEAFGTNYTQAFDHWTKQGLPVEGRRGSRELDVQFYVQAYPDLQEMFGTNYAAAFDHWIKHGLPLEGRQGSREFDARFYLATYDDLQGALGGNYLAALDHWITTGRAEGRLGVHAYHFRPLLFGDHRQHHFRLLDFGTDKNHHFRQLLFH